MQTRYPLCKAPLKRLYIQARKQDTQLVMARRSMPERKKPTQQFKLLLPVKRDARKVRWTSTRPPRKSPRIEQAEKPRPVAR